MDSMRKQIEELMNSVSGGGTKVNSFTDHSICKHYLCGLCPHDLFHNTKLYLGECRYTHSDEMKEEYLKARETKYYGYEEDPMRYMRPIVEDCDRKITRQTHSRGENIEQAKQSIQQSVQREIEVLDKEIKELIDEAQQSGSTGDIAKSLELTDKVAILQKRKKKMEDDLSVKMEETRAIWFQKLKPCEVCGALLSERDDESRLNEHLAGRIHIGFDIMRKHIVELNQWIHRHRNQTRATNLPPGNLRFYKDDYDEIMEEINLNRQQAENSESANTCLFSKEDYLREKNVEKEKKKDRHNTLKEREKERKRYRRNRHNSSRSRSSSSKIRSRRKHRHSRRSESSSSK